MAYSTAFNITLSCQVVKHVEVEILVWTIYLWKLPKIKKKCNAPSTDYYSDMIIWQARVAALSFSDIAGSTDRVQNSNSKMQFSLLKSKKKKKFLRENNQKRIWTLAFGLWTENFTEF